MMKNLYLYLYSWLNITNHKDIGILYLLFGFIAGIIGTLFSIIIRVELAYPKIQVLIEYWYLYIIVVNFIMAFFLAPLLIGTLNIICIFMYLTKDKSNERIKNKCEN